MTSLTLIKKVVRVEADLWIVAVDIVQPDLVMDYQPRLHATDLTDATIYAHALLYESIPHSLPCFSLIELLLGQHPARPLCFVVVAE